MSRPPRAERAHNYDAVADLVAERVEKSHGRISAKRLLPKARAAGYAKVLRATTPERPVGIRPEPRTPGDRERPRPARPAGASRSDGGSGVGRVPTGTNPTCYPAKVRRETNRSDTGMHIATRFNGARQGWKKPPRAKELRSENAQGPRETCRYGAQASGVDSSSP